MDIAWFSNGSFVLIELSPFFPCTGSALFNWQRDAELLHNGPYSLRLKDPNDLHPQMNELILCNWPSRWRLQDAAALVHVPPFTEVLNTTQPITAFSFISDTISSTISSLFDGIVRPSKQLLFVYGTLKRGFQWNTKYLAERLGCSFICEAVSAQVWNRTRLLLFLFVASVTWFLLQPMTLVLGESGVPYLLRARDGQVVSDASQEHHITGELWEVSNEAMQGLDEYEGVSKGYYSRTTIHVHGIGVFARFREWIAEVYVLNDAPEELVKRPRINEYTLDMHKQLYNAIVHVQRKQHAYLGWSASTWGKMADRVVGASGATPSS